METNSIQGDRLNTNQDDYREIIDRPITTEEITEAIKKLRSKTACGWDGIPEEVLKMQMLFPFCAPVSMLYLIQGIFASFGQNQ